MNKHIKSICISFNILLLLFLTDCRKNTTNQVFYIESTEAIGVTMMSELNNQMKSLDEILVEKGLKIEDILPNQKFDKKYHFTEYELYSEDPFIIKIDPNTMEGFNTNSDAYITEYGNVLISMDGVDVEVIGPKSYQELFTCPGSTSVDFHEYLDSAIWSYSYTLTKNNDRVLNNNITHDEDNLYFESGDLEITINGYTVHYNYKMCEFKDTDDNLLRTLATYASYVEVKNNLVFKCIVNYYGKSFIEDLPTPEEVLAGLYESILPIE